MSMIGLLGLLVAFAGCVISVLCLGVAHILYKKRSFERSDTFAWGGRVAAVLTAVALTVCCAVLVWCFFSGDNTIQYVLEHTVFLLIGLQLPQVIGELRSLQADLAAQDAQRQQGERGHAGQAQVQRPETGLEQLLVPHHVRLEPAQDRDEGKFCGGGVKERGTGGVRHGDFRLVKGGRR